MKYIQDAKNLKGKQVILRAGLNVHLSGDSVIDDFRILRTIPTITLLRQRGAKIIIISHIAEKEGDSLIPVAKYLESFFPVKFVNNFLGSEAKEIVDALSEGEVAMFENLRTNTGEKNNSELFSRHIASFGDVYVNDAFSVSHREHSSIVGLPQLLPSFAGLQFQSEIDNLNIALKPKSPSLLIIGGAKPETKIPLAKKFLKIVDYVFVGGVPANEFFKASGFEIGKSVVSGKDFDLNETLSNKHLIIPEDVLVKGLHGTLIKDPRAVGADEVIADVGPKSLARLKEIVHSAGSIVWNGPLGIYEEGFTKHTEELARAVSKSSAYSIVGGGDTFAVIGALRYEDAFSFVSTAGGAMIQYLLDGTLPGIKALEYGK